MSKLARSAYKAYRLAVDHGDFSALAIEIKEGNPFIFHPDVSEILIKKLNGQIKNKKGRPKIPKLKQRDLEILREVALLVARGFTAYEKTGNKLTACNIVSDKFSLELSSVTKIWDSRKQNFSQLDCSLYFPLLYERVAFIIAGEQIHKPPYVTNEWNDSAKKFLQEDLGDRPGEANYFLDLAEGQLSQIKCIGACFSEMRKVVRQSTENIVHAALELRKNKATQRKLTKIPQLRGN